MQDNGEAGACKNESILQVYLEQADPLLHVLGNGGLVFRDLLSSIVRLGVRQQ